MDVWCQCNTMYAPFAGHVSEMIFVHLLSVGMTYEARIRCECLLTPDIGVDCSLIRENFTFAQRDTGFRGFYRMFGFLDVFIAFDA